MSSFQYVCGRCGSPECRIKRIERGVQYCERCYTHMFPQVPCEKCSRSARIFKFDEVKICRRCRNASLHCARCDKLIDKAARRVGSSPLCGSCGNVFSKEERIHNLVDESPMISRVDVKSPSRPTKFITCKHCGKHRKPCSHYKNNGLCVECFEGDYPYHSCPQCGISVAGVGNSICSSCDRKNKVQSRIDFNVELLEETVFRERFLTASKAILNKSSPVKLIGRVDRLASAFKFLELNSKNIEGVDQKLIMSSIESEISRSYSTLANILSDVFAINWDAELENDVLESRRIEEIVMRNEEKTTIVLQKYLVYLTKNDNKEYKKKTIRVYLRCAEAFLGALCKDNDISKCSPESVRNFQLRNPGLRASLRVFFNFIEHVTGTRYASLSIRKTSDKKLDRLLREKCKNLASRINTSSDLSERKALTARVMSLLYGVPLKTVVCQTVDSFIVDGDDVYWGIDQDLISVPRVISSYILESIARKKSRFVFWGDGNERPMSTACVNYWI